MSQTKIVEILKSFPNMGPETNEPTADQLQSLLNLEQDAVFCFVNLLKYRKQANYPSEHELAEKSLSGREAYERYGIVALDHVTKRGGSLEFAGSVEMQIIGIGAEWDAIATMRYKKLDAFLDMVNDPDYQRELVHRDAGLQNSEVFVTRQVIKNRVGRIKFRLMRSLRPLITTSS